jgi:TfoX/Sxy family transcriptional regulator of competence genes
VEELRVPRKESRQNRAAAEIDPRFRPVVDAFANSPDVTEGKMMSSYGLKVNGKIFAMFGRKQFVTKLPKARVDALVNAGVGKNFDPGHDRLMKEWVVVADGGPDWLDLAKEAYEFVKRGHS